MDKEMNSSNEWLKALTRGEVKLDKPKPKVVYKDYQVSNKQRRGVMNGDK